MVPQVSFCVLAWSGPYTESVNESWNRMHQYRHVSLFNDPPKLQDFDSCVGGSNRGDQSRLSSNPIHGRPQWHQSHSDVSLSHINWPDTLPYCPSRFSLCLPPASHNTNTSPPSPFPLLPPPQRPPWPHSLLLPFPFHLASPSLCSILHSTSALYRTWLTARLVPWVHFIPIDHSFLDTPAVARFYLQERGDLARFVAESGRTWMQKMGRRGDAMVYLYRLMLEYARVCDDQREGFAWVEDLLQ